MSSLVRVIHAERVIKKLGGWELADAVASCHRRGIKRKFYRTVCDSISPSELHEFLSVLATDLEVSGEICDLEDLNDVTRAREMLLLARIVRDAASQTRALHEDRVRHYARLAKAKDSLLSTTAPTTEAVN